MAEILNRFAYAIAAEVDPRAFSEFERQGIAAGSAIKSSFGGIQSVINDALSVPRNAFGGLDIGIAKLREMERDLESVTIASREVAKATRQVEIAEGQTNRERVASIRNANAFATLKEQELARLRQDIALQERIQAELNQTASATDRVVSANRGGASAQDELARSVRGQRQAYIQANQQFQDIAISLAGGQRASTVLAQQLPQLGFALKDASGFAGKFGALLSGPAGIGIIGGLLVLGPLIDEGIRKLFGYGEASDKAGKSTFDFSKQIDSSKQSLTEYTDFITQLTSATKGLISTQAILADSTARTAQATVANTQSELGRVRAEIAALSKDLDGGIGSRNPLNAAANIEKAIRRNSLRGTEKLLTQSLAAAQSSVAESSVALSIRRVEETFDKAAKIKGEADRQIALLTQRRVQSANAENALKANKIPLAGAFGPGSKGFVNQIDFEKQLLKIKGDQRAAEDALNESKKRAGQTDRQIASERRRQINADIPTVSQLSKVVRDAFPGSRVTSGVRTPERNAAVGGKPNSRHLTGQAIDFVAPSGVSIGDVRNEFRQRGIDLREAIDEGDHFHIAVDKGKVELQGYADAARDAQKAAKILNDDLETVGRRFDASTAAGIKYQETLAAIERLSSAGKISADDKTLFTTDAIRDLYEAEIAAADKAAAEIQTRFFNGFEDGFSSLADEAADRIGDKTDAAIRAALQKVDPRLNREGFKALGGIADVFGNGPASLLDSLSRRAGTGDGVNSFLNKLGEGQKQANDRLADELNSVFNKVFGNGGAFANTLGAALAGAQIGGQAASFAKSLGIKGSSAGGQIGGALGAASGIPGGAIIGGLLGSTIGGLFKKTPKGTVSISNSGTSFSGSGKLRSGLTSTGDSVTDTLNSIAQQLGGSVGSFSTSIRQKKNSFFVGSQKFGSAQEASEAAILQQLQAGVISGIDAGAQRILQAGGNLDKALRQATTFQTAIDRIKESTDPLSAALQRITREFGPLRDALTAGGATAEQFAGLAALETKERKAALETITAGLRDLQRENSFGDTGRSLRDRQAAALAAFNPLEARVKAGDATAFDQFTDVGRQLRDINREIFGSQSGYFEFLDRLQSTTNAAIAGQENIASINSTAAPIVSALETQTSAFVSIIAQLNTQQGNLQAQTNATLASIDSKLSGSGGTLQLERLNFA